MMGSCNDWNYFNVGILKTNTKGIPPSPFGISSNYFFPLAEKMKVLAHFHSFKSGNVFLKRNRRQLIV